jgi:hypothetical protein
MLGRPVKNDFPSVGLVNRPDLVAQLALQPIHARL